MCRPSKIDGRCKIRLLYLLKKLILYISCMRITPRVCTSVLSLLKVMELILHKYDVMFVLYDVIVLPQGPCVRHTAVSNQLPGQRGACMQTSPVPAEPACFVLDQS